MSCQDLKLRFDLRDTRLGQVGHEGVVDSVGIGRAGTDERGDPGVPAASTVAAIDLVKRLVNMMSVPFRSAGAGGRAGQDYGRTPRATLNGFLANFVTGSQWSTNGRRGSGAGDTASVSPEISGNERMRWTRASVRRSASTTSRGCSARAGWVRCTRPRDTAKANRRAEDPRSTSLNDVAFRTRFQRESQAAAILQEPHVIPIATGARSTAVCTSTCAWCRARRCSI